MINWRGVPYYVGKSILGSQEWRACLRELQHSDIARLSGGYLRSLLRHASTNVPYYRALELQAAPLAQYPLLTKEQLRNAPAAFTRDDVPDQGWSRIKTSGSTGQPLEILADRSAAAWFEATDIWYLKEMLATPRWDVVTRSKVRLWSRSEDPQTRFPQWYRLARFLAPRTWLDPYTALSDESLMAYAREINKAEPAFIWAFAGVLYELARVATSRDLHLHRPRFIISSAETLHPFMRHVIEAAFGCRVYDYYGSAESGQVAGECRAGNLHIFSFACTVEVLDDTGTPVPGGDEGRLILTPLHNYAMPLIRYDTADMAEVGPSDCPCGCPLPALRRITGRAVEFFITRDGGRLSGGRIAQLMRHCEWVLSYQVVQEDLDHVTVYFKRMAGAAVQERDIDTLDKEISELLGQGCDVDWLEVDEIPRTPNGKRPYVRSLLWEARQPFGLWDAAR